jgi:hypothetical protein
VAAEEGGPTPSVTLYLVRPDRDVVDHYGELGVQRCVFLLPTRGDAVSAVQQIAWQVL